MRSSRVRKEVVPLADVLTPNQFEAELLTGAPARATRMA